jgi:hypothetical protein
MSDAAARYDFGLNPTAAVALHHVGEEAEPVLVIDGLMRDPAAMVDFAARDAAFGDAAGAGENFYPGVQAPAPLEYVGLVGRALAPLIQKAFGLPRARPMGASCNLSLVTLPPEALTLAQRLPHIDTVDPLQFAVLHFFCHPRFGGTAFYRHRSTGFETLTPERLEAHRTFLDRDIGRHPPPAAYVTGDTPIYQQTAAFEARFNRILVYRSRAFHSGQVDAAAGLSRDPRRGRLTANVFVTYRDD